MMKLYAFRGPAGRGLGSASQTYAVHPASKSFYALSVVFSSMMGNELVANEKWGPIGAIWIFRGEPFAAADLPVRSGESAGAERRRGGQSYATRAAGLA